MQEAGINTVVVLSVGRLRSDSADPLDFGLAPEGLLYPSRYLCTAQPIKEDKLEMILSLADERGMNVFLGSLQTETDWTDGTEFTALRAYNRRIAAEILERYGGHRSLRGWYFTQEIWMNWVKYYGADYYGTRLLADWVSDLKRLDPAKQTSAAPVIKKVGTGPMPGLAAPELQRLVGSFLKATALDVLMPQDGIGAENGAPSIGELPSYYRAMALGIEASGAKTALWDTLETFRAIPGVGGERYPPADASRIEQQIRAVRPYVSGYVTWIFGDDLSPLATYYPVQASELNRQFKSLFKPKQSQASPHGARLSARHLCDLYPVYANAIAHVRNEDGVTTDPQAKTASELAMKRVDVPIPDSA
jgi:hypothetical protein